MFMQSILFDLLDFQEDGIAFPRILFCDLIGAAGGRKFITVQADIFIPFI